MSSPTDGIVQLPADGTGKSVATQEVTRSDGTTVEIQEIANYAVVNDTPSSNILPGDLTALSLTTDGRLRVSTYPATFEIPMVTQAETAMWGGHAQKVIQDGSPWAGW